MLACKIIERIILSAFDCQNGIDACNFTLSDVLEGDHNYMRKSTTHSVSKKENVVCILLENYDFGVVAWEKGELACCCSGGISSKCVHVKALAEIIENDDEKPDFVYTFLATRFNVQSHKSTWFLSSKSYMPIPFELPERLNKIMFEKAECHVPFCEEGICFIPHIPSSGPFNKCDLCGSSWDADSPKDHDWYICGKLILRNFTLDCRVYYRLCSNTSCSGRLEYDGGEIALLNTGKIIITYDVLRDFMHHFLLGRHEDRIFVLQKDVRKALINVTGGPSSETLEILNNLLDENADQYRHLKQFLNWCISTFGFEWPPGVVAFILAIGKNSPVCAIFHADSRLVALCEKLLIEYPIKKHPIEFQLLSDTCPLLFQFLCAVPSDHLPKDVAPLLKQFLEIASSPFISTQSTVEIPCSRVGQDSNIAFFPNRPIIRERGSFLLDKRSEPKSGFCTKRSGRHPTLSPGIFLVQCRHGITYGFSVMTSCESPNIPFTVFRTRFLSVPSVIVYDNACNLHTYSLNRDPTYFKHTRFLVDRLHWPDHTGCSSAYDLSSYPTMDFPYLNSQGAEQRNSSLKRIKASLSYMNERNFMNHCKLFLYFHNRRLAAKLLREEQSMQEH